MESGKILSINNIAKRFGGVRALKGVSFDIKRGEILGLLGANGAGKSTLLKIIGGIEKADSGEIFYEGEVLHAENPHAAQKKGLISVYQELNVFLHMSAAENLFLGKEPKNKFGLLDLKSMTQQAREVFSAFGLDISPNTLLQDLSIAKRHLIEIVRAMQEAPKVLMLDEPTAVLSDDQIKWLFQMLRELVARGTTIIYVSHRLDEIVELCDRCVVLRDGSLSAFLEENFDKKQIIKAMIGRNINIEKKESSCSLEDSVFACENLSIKGKISDISFNICKGEILGIGGLVGAGRSELLRAIYGLDKLDSGRITINGEEIKNKHPNDAIRNKMVLISEDRKLEGLFLKESIVNNISANTIRKWSKYGFIKRKMEESAAREISEEVCLDTNRLLKPAVTLSGGNQQKVVLGKALLTGADILLLDEPTRGVDVGAREDIYNIIKSLASEGKSILLVSSDWEELLSLSDRLIVMSEGRMTAELTGDDISEEDVMHYSTIANIGKTETKAQNDSLLTKARDYLITSKSNTSFFCALLMVLMIVGTLTLPNFLSFINTRNILNQSFLYILLTLGQILVIIHGNADLSMSATMTVAGLLGLTIMKSGEGMLVPGILAMIVFGILIGIIIASIVVIGKMNPLIATFAIGMVLQGVALIITPRPISPSPDIFKNIVRATFLGLPLIFYIGLVIIIVFAVILKFTSLGRRIFAVGENSVAALWSGLSVKPTQFISFIICSVMAVIGSLFMLGRSGAAEATVAFRVNLDAVAFALIGGGSWSGGKGSIFGSVAAIFTVIVLMNILGSLNVGTHQRDVIRGVFLITIIALNEYRTNRAKSMVMV